MIYAFTGRTGSGKTYNMVRHAYRHYMAGRDIYSNTKLYFETPYSYLELLIYKFKKIYDPSVKLPQRGNVYYFNHIHEVIEIHDGVIMFDEGQVLFDAQEWGSLPSEFKYKLQQHRKHNLDLFTTTQSISSIDITYRRLVQYWFNYRPIFSLAGLNIFAEDQKDVDQLYRDNNELTSQTIRTRLFLIGRFSRVLYDTFYDIGFTKLKTIWHYDISKSKNYLMIVDKMSRATVK